MVEPEKIRVGRLRQGNRLSTADWTGPPTATRCDRSVEVRRVTSEPSLDRAARDCSAPSDLTPVQSRSVQGEHPLDFLSRPHLRYAPNSISRPSGETGKLDGLKSHCPKGLAGSNPASGTTVQLVRTDVRTKRNSVDNSRVGTRPGTTPAGRTDEFSRCRSSELVSLSIEGGG